jgi:hypothetical protein
MRADRATQLLEDGVYRPVGETVARVGMRHAFIEVLGTATR